MTTVLINADRVAYGLESISGLAGRFGSLIDVNFDDGCNLKEIDGLNEIAKKQKERFVRDLHKMPDGVQFAGSGESDRAWLDRDYLKRTAAQAKQTIEEVMGEDDGKAWIEKQVVEYKEGCEDFVKKLLAAKPFVDQLFSD